MKLLRKIVTGFVIIVMAFVLAGCGTAAMTDKIIDKIDSLVELPLIGKIVPDNELAKQEYRMLIIDSYIAFL